MDQAQLITIVILVFFIALFVSVYRRKKTVEKKMRGDLDASIQANDWHTVCRILRNQLILWGAMLLLGVTLLVFRVMDHRQIYTTAIICGVFAWRVFTLAKNYRVACHNRELFEEDTEPLVTDEEFMSRIEALLSGCTIHRIADDASADEVEQLWLDSLKRGRREGFCPVLVEAMPSEFFFDLFDEWSGWIDNDEFRSWQAECLRSSPDRGKEILRGRLDELREEISRDGSWESDVVGDLYDFEANYHFTYNDSGVLLLVEVPVKEPWQVFAYLPMGGWNECPTAEEHMAVAKYWYEQYGAVVAKISNDNIEYYVPDPVTEDDFTLAEEQLAYCSDIVLQGVGSLTTLAASLRESTVWYFWWD